MRMNSFNFSTSVLMFKVCVLTMVPYRVLAGGSMKYVMANM